MLVLPLLVVVLVRLLVWLDLFAIRLLLVLLSLPCVLV